MSIFAITLSINFDLVISFFSSPALSGDFFVDNFLMRQVLSLCGFKIAVIL